MLQGSVMDQSRTILQCRCSLVLGTSLVQIHGGDPRSMGTDGGYIPEKDAGLWRKCVHGGKQKSKSTKQKWWKLFYSLKERYQSQQELSGRPFYPCIHLHKQTFLGLTQVLKQGNPYHAYIKKKKAELVRSLSLFFSFVHSLSFFFLFMIMKNPHYIYLNCQRSKPKWYGPIALPYTT